MKCLFTFLLLIPLFSSAQTDSKPHTILWKIIPPKANGRVSYLMGTNHSYGGSFLDTFPMVKELMKHASHVAVESLPSHHTKAPSFKGGTPFKKLYNDSEYKIVDAWLAKAGMDPLHQLDSIHFPAILLMIHVTGHFMSQKDQRMKPDEDAIDNYIKRYAESENIRLLGLDSGFTVRENVLQFGMSDQEAAKLILKLVRSEGSEQAIGDNSYRRMDIDYHFKEQQPFKKDSDFYHLLVERNTHWMKKLPDLLKANACFVAVGIEHLKYKTGLLQQLKQQGFKVEPVRL